jgi:hypothetical protein
MSPCAVRDRTILVLRVNWKIEGSLNLVFYFQMQRRAFGQNAIDHNARLDSVSVALGH